MTLDIVLISTTAQKHIREWQIELLGKQTDMDFGVIQVLDKNRADARNEGATQSKADILLFIDGDIFLSNDHVRYLKEYHSGNPGTTMYGRFFEIAKAEKIEDILNDPYYAYHAPLLMEDCNNLTNWQTYQSCCFSIERNAFEAVGGFDPVFQGWGGEDTDLFYRLENMGIRLIYNATLAFWHLNHGHRFHENGKGNSPEVYRNMVVLFLKHPCKAVFDNVKGFFKMQYMNDYYENFVKDYQKLIEK